jgi:dihydrofolate reductase
MRRSIAALQVSLDGFIEGPNGELDWAMAENDETLRNVFETLSHVDTFVLG